MSLDAASTLRERVKQLRDVVRGRLYAGDQVVCPVCDSSFRSWVDGRSFGRCPACTSATRTRFLFHVLQARPGILQTDGMVLHFAPENCLRRRLRIELRRRYVTTDLRRHDVTTNQDITDMTFDDGSFATVICGHVLEHIPDDQRALREMHRVLRPGGTAVIQVPLSLDAPTDEDPTVTDPAERKLRWGEPDHLRKYGLDLRDRLGGAGFDVEVLICEDVAPESLRRLHGLDPNGRIFVARR